MPDLLQVFQSRAFDGGVLKRGEHVLAAVSGGVDSVVLLDLLVRSTNSHGIRVSVAHLNHGLRGEEADADQRFVEDLCRRLQLEFYTEKQDVARYAQVHRLSVEAAARVVRYEFLRRVKERIGANVIATGHNADDQVETVIDHFLRGSGLLGLSGMAARRGDVARPLLWAWRSDIERYARERNLAFRIDTSNMSLDFRRNRIRLELLPYLRRYFNPNVREVVLRTASIMAEAEAYIEQQARALLREARTGRSRGEIVLRLSPLVGSSPLLRKYAVLAAFEELGGARWMMDFDRMERASQLIEEGTSGARLYLGSGLALTKSQDTVAIHRLERVEFSYPLEVGKSVMIPELDMIVSAEVVDRSTYAREMGRDPRVEFIDLEAVRGRLYVRNARPGDRFRPLGSRGTKKLSDFFTDAKVPTYYRWRTPVVVDDENIIWVCGLRIDDRYRVKENTHKILKLSLGDIVGGEE